MAGPRDSEGATAPTSSAPAQASFRDPAGHVVVLEHRVLRFVRSEATDDLDRFLASQARSDFESVGRFIGTRTLQKQEGGSATPAEAEAVGTDLAPGDRVLEHDKVEFPSFPYEWPAPMLHEAAVLTLDLMERLLDEDLGLKDATPYNVLYRGPTPVFIDILSVESRHPRDAAWTPFAQFVRTMLLPLLAEKRFGWCTQDALLAHRDGPDPEQLYRMSRWQDRWRRPFLSLVTLPTLLSGRAEKQAAEDGDALYGSRLVADPERAEFHVRRLLATLRRHTRRLAPAASSSSNWSRYMETRDHYAGEASAGKDRFLRDVLLETRPAAVLDAGCNTGHFSVMAAQAGARVVAVDLDPVSVGALWRRARDQDLDILPLVVDLSRPTPAVGWRNRECPSFLERAEGQFDCVLMLALMHHLHVSERIPVDEIVDLAWQLTRRHLVFEYVGPGDPMFQRLLRGREHLHEALERTHFEAALAGRFRVVRKKNVAPPEPGRSDRTLYLLERLPATPAVLAGQESEAT